VVWCDDYLSSQCPNLMMTEPHVSPAPKPAIATCVTGGGGFARVRAALALEREVMSAKSGPVQLDSQGYQRSAV